MRRTTAVSWFLRSRERQRLDGDQQNRIALWVVEKDYEVPNQVTDTNLGAVFY